jgi:hypothetical protein
MKEHVSSAHRRSVGSVTLVLAAVPAMIAHTSNAGRYVATAPVCGVARWPVKTVSDAAAASIDTKPVLATLLGMTTVPAPLHVGNTLPRQGGYGGVEFKTYRLRVRLLAWKLSDDDSDIHVEVGALDGPQTLVTEFPLAGCIAKSASATNRRRMARAKAAQGVRQGSSADDDDADAYRHRHHHRRRLLRQEPRPRRRRTERDRVAPRAELLQHKLPHRRARLRPTCISV